MSKVNLEELLNNQWEIDKIYGEVKALTKSHNEYIDYKKISFDEIYTNDKEFKRIIKSEKRIIFYFLLAFGFQMLLLIGEIISPFLSLNLVHGLTVLFFSRHIWLQRKKIGLKNKIEAEDIKKKENDDKVYEELCEKRSLYHQMNKEQENIVNQLPSEEYQEYLKLLDEYFQVLNNIKEKCGETNQEKAPVIPEKPKKRWLIPNFFSK